MGAQEPQLSWVRDHGFRLRFTGIVPRIASVRNNPGCRTFGTWFWAVIEEFLYLGLLTEVSSANLIWCLNPFNMVEKLGYDALLMPWRLRLILDQRKVNEHIDPPRFRMESLHSARHLFEPSDVILTIDLSAAFFHVGAHPESRKYMECMIGGRFFRWNASSSLYVFQTLVWVLVRRWRKDLGLRLVAYQDDFGVLCKPHQVKSLARFLLQEFAEHGFLVNVSKSDLLGACVATLLGVEIDLSDIIFWVPDAKKEKICLGIEDVLLDWRARQPVWARVVAKTYGRIMATLVTMGIMARQMTCNMYTWICKVVSVPVCATRREIRVAWDTLVPLSNCVVLELLFWLDLLPDHTGSPIRQ